MASAVSLISANLHVSVKPFLMLSLRNPDPHGLSHASSANKAVNITSLNSGGIILMLDDLDIPEAPEAGVTAQLPHGSLFLIL